MSNVIVKAKYGTCIVNDQDQYVGRAVIEYGEFSESEVDLFKQIIKPGMTVVDVGANYGIHTLVYAKIVGNEGQVYAFEPQRQVFNALCGTLALNNISNVIPICAAVGTGSIVKYSYLDYSEFQNVGAYSFCDVTEGEDLPTVPLIVPCHFLKIDVEGMELEVLKGAERMIRACKPIMYIEADRPAKNEEMFAFIRDLGYEIYWHAASFVNPNNFFENPVDLFPGIASINVLCVPKETKVEGMEIAFASEWHNKFVTQN